VERVKGDARGRRPLGLPLLPLLLLLLLLLLLRGEHPCLLWG